MAQAINKKINWYNVSDVFIFEGLCEQGFFRSVGSSYRLFLCHLKAEEIDS